jgi:Predicted xylanase/chitin deacetylase
MNWDELAGHADRGVLIGSHSVSHPHLAELNDDELRRELNESKAEIEDRLGRFCSDLAYPYGEQDERVRLAARGAMYERAYALRRPQGGRMRCRGSTSTGGTPFPERCSGP